MPRPPLRQPSTAGRRPLHRPRKVPCARSGSPGQGWAMRLALVCSAVPLICGAGEDPGAASEVEHTTMRLDTACKGCSKAGVRTPSDTKSWCTGCRHRTARGARVARPRRPRGGGQTQPRKASPRGGRAGEHRSEIVSHQTGGGAHPLSGAHRALRFPRALTGPDAPRVRRGFSSRPAWPAGPCGGSPSR
jgi:hypothetical protein